MKELDLKDLPNKDELDDDDDDDELCNPRHTRFR